MLEKQSFQSLMASIVTSQLDSTGQEHFETEGELLIDDLYHGLDITKDDFPQETGMELGISVKEGLELLGLLAGTFNTIKECYALFKGKNGDVKHLEEKWLEELELAGVEENKRKIIVSKFIEDLKTSLQK